MAVWGMNTDSTSVTGSHGRTQMSAVDESVDRVVRQTLVGTEALEQSAKEILVCADHVLHHTSGRPCRRGIIEGLAHRYGLLGRPPATLEAVGAIIGVTRERARQIQVKHEPVSKIHQIWWPQLDAALEVARLMAPCTEDALANELVRRHITMTKYSLGSLRACAAFAGRPFELDAADGIVAADLSAVTAVLRATRELSSRQGLASALQISDEILDAGFVLAEEEVRALLSASIDVVWLDSHHITHNGQARNRLVNTLRTMLSVHQPVELDVAQQAVANYWSYRNAGRRATQPDLAPPTTEALRAFCQWHDEFAVTPAGIIATVELDHATELGVEAALLVEVIRSSPNEALDRVSLMETAEAVGMKPSTVSVYLTFHPAFVQHNRNVWTVQGTQVSSDLVGSIQRQARLRSKSENHDFRTGRSPDGQAWASFAVTSNFRLTGVLLRRWLPPDTPSVRLAITDGQGDPCGAATYNDDTGFTHGFSVYIRRFDLRVGEYVHVLADVEKESARIFHGADGLVNGPPTHADLAASPMRQDS